MTAIEQKLHGPKRDLGRRYIEDVKMINKPWSQYEQIIVETYYAVKSGKTSRIHVRPIAGQPFPATMDVECSRSMRTAHPIGTKFRIYAKQTSQKGGKPFLYTNYNWPVEIIE
jgi:hypothetical protein